MMTFTGFTVGIYNVGPDFSMVLYSQHASVYIATSFFYKQHRVFYSSIEKAKKEYFRVFLAMGPKWAVEKFIFSEKLSF